MQHIHIGDISVSGTGDFSTDFFPQPQHIANYADIQLTLQSGTITFTWGIDGNMDAGDSMTAIVIATAQANDALVADVPLYAKLTIKANCSVFTSAAVLKVMAAVREL